MKINIPSSPEQLLQLSKAIQKKHLAMGDNSPLKNIVGMETFGDLIEGAENSHGSAIEFARKAENATEVRDNVLGQNGAIRPNTVKFFVTSARDVLAGINKTNLHALGEWGFDVANTTASRPPAETPVTAKVG